MFEIVYDDGRTPDHEYPISSPMSLSGVGIEMIKMDDFQYFSIKSYVVDVYKNRRGDSNTHPKHMILWRTYDN